MDSPLDQFIIEEWIPMHIGPFDLSITKTKEGKRTTYSTKAYPPKPVSPDIEEAVEASELDPKNLFKEAEDDFKEFGSAPKKVAPKKK